MMFPLVALAHAAPPAAEKPGVVVTVGDGLVVGEKPASESAGIAAGLGDCLEERARGRFGVVDRSVAGDTVAAVKAKLADVASLAPAWIVVTLGARELSDPATDPARLAADLGALAKELGSGRKVVVVGAVPAEGGGFEARVALFNEGLSALDMPGVVSLDPGRVKRIPKEGLVDGARLTAAGQAKVVAAVCDLVLGSP